MMSGFKFGTAINCIDGRTQEVVIDPDTYGNLITAMHKVISSPTATSYHIAQYDTFRNPEKVEYLQKQLLRSKLSSQIERLYKFKHGMKRRDGLSMCREITIAENELQVWQNILKMCDKHHHLALGHRLEDLSICAFYDCL